MIMLGYLKHHFGTSSEENVIVITLALGVFLKSRCSAFTSVLFLPLHQRYEGGLLCPSQGLT